MAEQIENQTLPLPSGHATEPIPGYRVVERIGVGGYGEVWKAEAPGGLTKALKFVYGHLDDARASREMKALSRIKEVRHPFLLSLERIEIVDGHLIIVTELAQSNLKELFVECQRAGMTGIPRERLLAYLRDAADALDYMCTEHNLQHLDVKPENLLLVADRVKVADFGLVRELFDSSASMMGGLTPNYAPPEVFDGRPASHSDQYSLAIVYQEMLTGVLPFLGRTAAQLAAQHMHSQPRLDPLPPTDRMTIGRALSKDPNKRFANCGALIDALMKPGSSSSSSGSLPGVAPPIISPRANSVTSCKTMSLDDAQAEGGLTTSTEYTREDKEVVSLPPLELTGQCDCRPTVFLGVGGMAAATLRALRRRLQDRLGDLENVPALQMLLLDTDQAALAAACSETDTASLRVQDTLALPLRRTQDYRGDSERFLPWMSRRWIYNIPRSRQTEGLRPLGRLALVDHAEQVMDRLRDAIRVATDSDHVAASSQATGQAFAAASPRVFILASTSGGTGSGMVLDLAYATRQILTELGFADEGVCGILTHHTERRQSAHDLAVANTLACLQELNHYSEPSSHYPGDAVCGLASFNGRTFHHAYVLHLGDELGAEEFAAAADRVSEFLYCNAVTGAGEFFDRCRQQESIAYPVDCPETSLRTFGISQLGLANSNVPAAMSELVCRQLVDDWLGGKRSKGEKRVKFCDVPMAGTTDRTTDAIDQSIDQLAAEQCTVLQLDIDRLSKLVHVLVKHEMGRDPDAYFADLVHQFVAKHRGHGLGVASELKELFGTIDSMLDADSAEGDASDSRYVTLQAALNEKVIDIADERAMKLQEWIYNLVNNSSTRIRGAQRATTWFTDHLQKLARQTSDRVEAAAQDTLAVRRELLQYIQEQQDADPTGSPLLARYFHFRLHQVVLRSVAKTLRRICEVHVAEVSYKLRDLVRDLGLIAAQFDVRPIEAAPTADRRGGLTFQEYVRWAAQTALSHRSAELVVQVESELFGENRRLHELLNDNAEALNALADLLRAAARRVLRRAVKEVNVADVVLAATPAESQDSDVNPLRQSLKSASPPWPSCGGGRRLLAIAPNSSEPEVVEARFRKHLNEPLNLLFDSDGDLVFCYEAEGLAVADIVAALTAGRPDLAEVASRLHARVDVHWRSL